MSDHVEDHDTDQDMDQDQAGPDQDDLVWMPSKEAAPILGLKTARSVRKWREAGKVPGRMVSGMWYVGVTRDEVEQAGVDVDSLIEEYGETGANFPQGTVVLRSHEPEASPGPVDFGPMADLIADLTRQVATSQAAAAMYQERSNNLEARLNTTTLALESGKVEATETERRLEEEKRQAIEEARREAAAERDAEWRSKSWWERLKGE